MAAVVMPLALLVLLRDEATRSASALGVPRVEGVLPRPKGV